MPAWLRSLVVTLKLLVSVAAGIKLAAALPDAFQATAAFVVFVASNTVLGILPLIRPAAQSAPGRRAVLCAEVAIALAASVALNLDAFRDHFSKSMQWEAAVSEVAAAVQDRRLLGNAIFEEIKARRCDANSSKRDRSRCAVLLVARREMPFEISDNGDEGASDKDRFKHAREFRRAIRRQGQVIGIEPWPEPLIDPNLRGPHLDYGRLVTCLIGAPILLAKVLAALFALMAPALLLDHIRA